MNNVIEKHISNVEKRFKKYNNLVLKSRYDKDISDGLIQAYIEARYYNYGTDETIRFFYRRVYDALRKKADLLIKKEPRKKELIDNTVAFFQYYFYFDKVRKADNLEKIVDSIAEKRIFKLNLRSAINDNFKEEFLELVKQDMEDVEIMLEAYESEDFNLELSKVVPTDSDYYRASLSYNFSFPKIFSEDRIEELFNTDIIAEDKLFVEYPMIAIQSLKDILNGNFTKVYVCDFAASLLSKKKKTDQVLQAIENQAGQDKICFEINYSDFLQNKEDVFNLIKRGFRFALETNSDMPKLTAEELKILEVFSCIIVDTNDINKKKYKNVKILQK